MHVFLLSQRILLCIQYTSYFRYIKHLDWDMRGTIPTVCKYYSFSWLFPRKSSTDKPLKDSIYVQLQLNCQSIIAFRTSSSSAREWQPLALRWRLSQLGGKVSTHGWPLSKRERQLSIRRGQLLLKRAAIYSLPPVCRSKDGRMERMVFEWGGEEAVRRSGVRAWQCAVWWPGVGGWHWGDWRSGVISWLCADRWPGDWKRGEVGDTEQQGNGESSRSVETIQVAAAVVSRNSWSSWSSWTRFWIYSRACWIMFTLDMLLWAVGTQRRSASKLWLTVWIRLRSLAFRFMVLRSCGGAMA